MTTIINGVEQNSFDSVLWSAGNGGGVRRGFSSELITIPVGSGLDPVVLSTGYLAPINSFIWGILCYVVQAPGGGATTFSLKTDPENYTYFSGITVAQGVKTQVYGPEDAGSNLRSSFTAAQKIKITTDADVTGSDMKIRIGVYWEQFIDFTS
jgi:hypothetical protein